MKRNLVWLELTGCSGNIISLLDGSNPDFKYLISQMTNLIFNNSLSASEGQNAMEMLLAFLETTLSLRSKGLLRLRITACIT